MVRRFAIPAVTIVLLIGLVQPANAQFAHSAVGSGRDGLGNRLTILAGENILLGGGGIAFVRLANESGPAQMVILNCIIFDDRPGPGFQFLYSSGRTLSGRAFFIGVFDDGGFGRTGPYDAIYTQTTPVNGPCNVAAVESYPIGWDPVSSGDFVITG
jgi:hypothetical protein